MKNLILLILLTLICTSGAIAQEDQLIVKKRKGYFQNDQLLKPKELKSILKSEPACAPEMKKGASMQTIGLVTQTVVQVGIIAATFPSIMGILGGTAAGLAVGLPLAISADKHYAKAIEVYNNKRQPAGAYVDPPALIEAIPAHVELIPTVN